MRAPNMWEAVFLGFCEHIWCHGHRQPSRVGPVYMMTGQVLTVEMTGNHFPLLTTRRMYPKPILGELAAFLRGYTNNGQFMAFGCNYWTPNARKHYAELFPGFENNGSDEELELGPIYGKQWRDFGGVDQIAQCRELLKNDPWSRRAVVTAMNPPEEPRMCLPPCHTNFQFNRVGNRLDLTIYMRSVDVCLGLPSDIALYYTLLILMAQDVKLDVGMMHFAFGNAHVYEAHAHQLENHLQRLTDPPPRWVLREKDPEGNYTDLFHPDDLEIVGYSPQGALKYELLV